MAVRDIPTESVEQQCLIRWAAYQTGRYPELALLFHVPNEGKRSRATGGRMIAEGLRTGVPDLVLPVPRGEYSGLFIEMKRREGGRVSAEQRWWIDRLREQGYRAEICKGWEAAADTILQYLKEEQK